MRGKTSKGSFSFRHMDELIVLLAVFFFIFGCIIIPEPPIPVELTTFADLSTGQALQFDSPGDTDSFQLNISRYTTVGNSSRSNPDGTGVIQNFSMRICPTEHMGSNASNLTIFWPTGGSTLFYPGTLTSCQQISVNASGFNDYLFVHQAPSMANFATYLFAAVSGGGTSIALEWGISQENPKMHDVDEPVTYQLLIIEPSVPDDLLEQLVNLSGTGLPPGFDLLLDARLSGISYTCYDWDQVREVTSPSEVYPVQLSVPGINLSSLIPGLDVPNGTVIMNATVFDLPCPAYGTPGKYRAQVRRMLFTLINYTGPVPTISFMDDFNTPALNPQWLFMGVNESGGVADYNYLPALSKIDLISEPATPGGTNTANALYFNQELSAPTTNESGVYVVASIYFDENQKNAAPGLYFVNETITPTTAIISEDYQRGGIFYSYDHLVVLCPNLTQSIAFNLTQVTPLLGWAPVTGWHELAYYSTNDTTVFLYDAVPISINCSPHNDTFYVGLSSDPLTDAMYGNTSIGRFELYAVEYEEGYYGDKWFDIGLLSYMEYLNNSIYSDVLVFDEDDGGDFYGRLFDFEVSSDTPGIVQVDNLNITYGSLVSYGPAGTTPTTTLDQGRDFSWFAINSNIDNSDMRLNSFAYNSTITDSELVLSRVDCVNVTNSHMVFSGVIYTTEEQYLGDMSSILGDIVVDGCSGEVVNSELEFVFMIAGDVRNSQIKTVPIMIATDFNGATVDNLTLYSGQMVMNGTRVPSIFGSTLDLSDFMGLGISFVSNDTGVFFGCEEDAEIAFDSAADLRVGNAPMESLNCRFNLYNSNFTLDNVTFDNQFGGVRVSLHNSAIFIQNETRPFNLTTYGQLTDVVIWDIDTSHPLIAGNPIMLSDQFIYVETGMASINGSEYGGVVGQFMEAFDTSLIFHNVADWDGQITYYDNYTTNRTEAEQNGIACPVTQCYNIVFDEANHVITMDVKNFSTYVVNYTIWYPPNATNATPSPSGPHDLDYNLQIEGVCAGEPVTFAASSSGLGVEGLDANIYGPNSTLSLYASFETGMDGTGTFTPEEPGNYHYQVSEHGYESKAGMISIIICEAEEEPPEEEPEVPQEEPEVPEEEPECTSDSDCPTGYWCMDNECVLAIEPIEEPTPIFPSSELEVPSTNGIEEPPAEVPSVPSCCLFGICWEIFGICWHYWAIAIIVLLLAAAYIYYFAGQKKPAGKKR